MNVMPVHVAGDVQRDDRLGPLLLGADVEVSSGDVVVVASKIVAKAEGRCVPCLPSEWESLVRAESRRILRERDGLMITETPHGFVCANAGIDRSNTEPGTAVLLPKDPDRSAHVLRNELKAHGNVDVAVVVTDTNGRAWREGVVEQAIGCAGLCPIENLDGTTDAFDNTLSTTQVCIADELAAAAGLVMNKAGRIPFAVIRGVDPRHFGAGSIATDVIRKYRSDLFR